MKSTHHRLLVYLVVAALMVGLFSALTPAAASVQGRRNTAWALTGLAALNLARGHTGTGVVLGAGAAYAWHRANAAKHHRHHVVLRHHRVARRHHHYVAARRHRSAYS